MATVAELMIKLGMDDSGLDKGMSSSQSKLNSWGASLRSVGTKLTAGVTLPIVAAGAAAIKWASDLEESGNKVDVVFGDSAAGVKAWAQSTQGSLLMSTSAAQESAGTFGNLFTSMGMGQEEAAGLSMDLVELGQDLSSFNNIPTDQALIALRAALVGEYEPMRALGVQLSQATVEQKALEMGIWDGNGALTAQQRVLATNALIMEQTTNAQGDAARTAKSFANQMRTLRANLEDVGAEMGKRLLPYVNRFLEWAIDMLDAFGKLDSKWQTVIMAIAGIAAALGPLLLMLGFLLPAFGALATVIGFLLSPIGLLVIAIAALIGLGIYAFINDLWGVRDAVYGVVDALRVFEPMLGDLMDAFQAARDGDWNEVFDELKDAAISLGQALFELQGIVAQALAGLFGQLLDWVVGYDWYGLLSSVGQALFEGMQAGIDYAWPIVSAWLADLPNKVLTALDTVADWGMTLLQKGSDLIAGLLQGVSDKWPDVTAWAATLPGLIVAAAEAAGSFLLILASKGGDLLQGLLDGLAAKWPVVQAWLALVGAVALAAVGNVARSLYQKGLDLIAGIIDGLNDKWETAKAWLSLVGTIAFAAVGNVAQTLYDKGMDLIGGMLDGLNDKWETVQAWLSLVASLATAAVGDLSGALVAAGAALMDGLKAGIDSAGASALAAAVEWASSIASAVASFWKVGSPSKLFAYYGEMLGAGLVQGMDASESSIVRAAESMSAAATVDGSAHWSGSGAGGASAYPTVVNNYALTANDLTRLLQRSEMGASFAEGFGNQLGLYGGTP